MLVERTADQMVDIPVPPVMEEIVAVVQEVVRLLPQERVQRRTAQHAPVPQITACRRGGVCPCLQRRRCFFDHSAEEVAVALLVGSEDPRDDVLELAAEVQGLRGVVQRLAGTIMWDRASPAATAVAVEAVTLVPRELVQQRTAEPIEDIPQAPDETVEAVTLVPREQAQQRTAEPNEDIPQVPAETVEAVTLVPREQAQQ